MTPGRLLKKIFSLILSALAVLIVSGFLSLQPISESPVYAQTGSDCKNITMLSGSAETSSVLVDGVANSGTMNFDDPKFDANSRGCVKQTKNALDSYDINGWAWNTNLGWMSFYCGADGTNRGFSCGATQYGAYILSDGKVRGFGWGDNIGWINMGCDSGKNGTTDCGTVDYGVKAATADGEAGTACPNSKKGDLYGYAWTDTVGWMNFCGAHVDLPDGVIDTIPPDTTPSPSVGVIDEYSQVADIQGNVSINIVDTAGLPGGGKIGQSLGEQAQSRRESFYRAIKATLKDAPSEQPKIMLPKFFDGVLYYKSSAKKAGKKIPCSIILDDYLAKDGEIDIQSTTTIVAKGCDFFIDSNITGSGRLGIIALADLTISGDQKGGNVYVCGRVTDIEANLVMDGALMSYGNATDATNPCKKSFDSTTGYPIFGYADFKEAISNITEIREFLRNQLTIYGSLISNNTYGGSASIKDPPEYVLGDGSIAATQEEARLFDINYLRYAKTELMSGTIDEEKCWTSDVGLSKYFGVTVPLNPCDLANTPDTTSIVNIIYRVPTNKMPVFNVVK